MDPQEIPGGPRAKDRFSRSAKDFLKVTETLVDTWLDDPVRKGLAVGDWDLHKAFLPKLSKPLSSLAPRKKSGPGKSDSTVPHEVPMIFADPKVSDLLHSDSGLDLEGGKYLWLTQRFLSRIFCMPLPKRRNIFRLKK